MKKSVYNFNRRRRIFLALCVVLLTGISFFINYKNQTEAESKTFQTHNYSLKGFKPQGEISPTVNIGERTSVWLKLQEGKPLDTTFHGSDAAISALQSNLAEPTAQFSADINADGYADLVSGFRGRDGGGLIALHRANKQAFEPTDEQVLADLKRGAFPAAFEKDALILDVPTAPDFIFAGKFSRDSAVDLVFASRGGSSIYLMTSDGRGGFNAPREINLGGEITALASENINPGGTYRGVIAAVGKGKSSSLVIFNGRDELLKTAPRSIEVDGRIDSMIAASTDFANSSIDLFGLADGKIFTVRDIGNPRGGIETIDLPFGVVDFAVGEFIRDRQGRAEIAVLSESGTVSYLKRGTLDTRPFTEAEMREFFRRETRGNSSIVKPETDNLSNDWSEAEQHHLGVYALGGDVPRVLRKAYITGNETEDVMVLNREAKRVQILFKEPNTGEDRSSFTGETKIQNVDFADAPATVLPMRLNVMGQQGFVVFSKGSLEPATVMFAPNAVFNVSKTNDTNDTVCDADCSLREAIVHSNGLAGADMVNIPGATHQLTIDNPGDENASAEGDLDVLQALTVVGGGSGSTIIQAGTTTANGIDKVFSVNPTFTMAFASSFTGMTMRFGRNPDLITADGFGGGLDWEGSGTGTISISNTIADQNTATDGRGGGFALTNNGAGTATITNSTVSNNVAARTSGLGGVGGGIFVGTGAPFSMTNVVINNNSTTSPISDGGGLSLFGPNTLTSTFTGVTFTNNDSTQDGGGLSTSRGTTFNSPTIISNNTAARRGGGLSMESTNITVSITEATLVGNSAVTNGGAIAVGISTPGQILNMSFSRIAGNTGGGFTGLVTRGGTANVENNWWGCNTGPSAAPCDTAGVDGAGTVDFDPWLQLRLTAGTTTPVVGQSTGLTASFLLNSAGGAVALSNLDVLIGLPVTWSASGGTISAAQATIQANGQATATFTPTAASPPNRTATAQVDSGPATVSFTVGKANTALSGLGDSPDPSVVGQPYTVSFTLSVVAPGAGTPTGTVTVTDGTGGMCVANLPSTSCMLTSTSVGSKTLTFTYSGDANFNGTMLTAGHLVNKANTTTTITAESADPTAQGQVFTVFYIVTVNSPGAGTPTGTVTVTDGANSCMGTVAAGQCSLFLNNAGIRTLTATYGSDTNFNGSVSAGEMHTVLPIVAASVSISGRVQTQTGRGIAKARIILTDQNGEVITAISNGFGYYRFEGIQVGETYFFNVRHKEYQFAPQAVTVNDDVQDLNFTALE